MSKTVQWKRGNTVVNSTYTGAQGEITVDTTDWSLYVHDGVTQGGYKISNDSDTNVNIGNLAINDQTISGTVSGRDIQIIPLSANIVIIGNLIPNTNVAYSLGSSSNQWKDLWVSNNTIYINSVPLTLSADNTLSINGNPILSSNTTNSVVTSGNISANYFIGNGSLLTGISTTGQWAFNSDTAYNSSGNGLYIQPSQGNNDGSIYLPYEDEGSSISIQNYSGGGIELGINGNAFWTFGSDGSLTFPINFDKQIILHTGAEIKSTAANVIEITTGNEDYLYAKMYQDLTFIEQFIEDDHNGANPAWSWINLSLDTVDTPEVFVEIQKGSDGIPLRWTFNSEGNLVLPSNVASINYANGTPYGGGTGTVIQANSDATLSSLTLTATPYVGNPLIGSPITFVHTNYGDEVDNIDTNVAITRGENNGIYNPLVEGGWNQNESPVNTVWNSDGWGDLADVKTRSYGTFYQALGARLGANVINKELVMHDTENDRYYAIKFLNWTLGGNGGGFSYTRQEINAELIVDFIHTDYGDEVDTISPGVAITRDTNNGIYNPEDEGTWEQDYSPGGTLWNADGWDDLSNINTRNYIPFFQATNGQLGLNVIGKDFVMHDTVADEYYTVKFHSWTQGGNGGGFSYTRRLIDKSLIGLGVKFADGTTQTTAYVPGQETTYTWATPEGLTWKSNEYHSGSNIVITANTTVKWFDADLAYNGGSTFSGAIINYQAKSIDQGGIIIGQIMIANDYENFNVTHTEVTSGPSNLGTLSLWETDPNNNSERSLWAKRFDGNSDIVWIQYTARMFYSPMA